MNTELLPATEEASLLRAAELLSWGNLVSFPTDTVYGLAAAAFNSDAVRAIYIAKNRPEEKAIPVLISSLAQLELVSRAAEPIALRLAQRFWPGPLTLIMPANPRLPEIVSVGRVGVRIPNHYVALAIIERAGPLAVTSANLSGNSSPVTAANVLDQLNGRIPLIIDGGPAPGGMPSTVVECIGGEMRILRPGPLTMEQLSGALS